jgi:hypothetical protein
MVFIDNVPSMTVIPSSGELPRRFFEPETNARYQPNHPQHPSDTPNELFDQPTNKGLPLLLQGMDHRVKTASKTGTEDCQHSAIPGHTHDPEADKISMGTDQGRGHDDSDEKRSSPAHVSPYCPTNYLPYSHCVVPSAVPPVSPQSLHSPGKYY